MGESTYLIDIHSTPPSSYSPTTPHSISICLPSITPITITEYLHKLHNNSTITIITIHKVVTK